VVSPGIYYNRLKSIYNNVGIVFEGNDHPDELILIGVGLPLQKANRLYVYNNM